MTAYELMIKANHYLIQGGTLTEKQKSTITEQLLSAQSTPEQARRFYAGVKYPKNTDDEGRQMYPFFYIPPYNAGKKHQTVIPLSPKTHILSANAYELEILRLLQLFAPNHTGVRNMVEETIKRLKTTCFGYKGCYNGECFESALIVLRFLAATAPDETAWQKKLINLFDNHVNDKRRHGNVFWYFWLCLSELPMSVAEPGILHYEADILRQLSRSSVMNSENDKTNHPVMICAIRNAIARLPQYAHLKSRQPNVNEWDGRLHFDM